MKRVKKMLMLTGLAGMMCFSVCACQNGKDAPAENQQSNASGAAEDATGTEETATPIRKFPSESEQQQINRALQQMKKDGILDENGQPMPGVDLNDYPGLG